MKPDILYTKERKINRRLLYFNVFLFIFTPSFTQNPLYRDTIITNTPLPVIPEIDNIKVTLSGTDFIFSPGLIPPGNENKRTLIFLDSLKNRASKTLITKKLYDFIIISKEPESEKEIRASSDINFLDYSGFKIRKLEIKRLNVFGSNISTPDFYDPNEAETLLNKTHFNTNENIIRKNLLFNEGDTISPLTLSDNERLLRELPFIDDSRILVLPVSQNEADVIVITKDIYSLGANVSFNGFDKGSLSLYERNIFGMGHEFGIQIPYDSKYNDSPGLGVNYEISNINKSFVNLDIYYYDGLGVKNYGFDINRKLVSTSTKYAGNISVKRMITSDDLDSLPHPEPVKLNLQDYWLLRSFLLDANSATRLIIGARYTNRNVFSHPFILPESYHHLQQYKIFLASISYSVQKYYKTSLVYGYGRTEDIPHGALFNITGGNEINEFKKRKYISATVAAGESFRDFGYIYSSAGFGTFLNDGKTEQGIFSLSTNFISNLFYMGRYRVRNFARADFTRGFDRYSDEYLFFKRENGFSGFLNDSIGNSQRLSVSLESVIFFPVNLYGFRFAVFCFADAGFLFGTNEYPGSGDLLSAAGLGIRIRNDNLVLNTLQIRLGFFPHLPEFSRTSSSIISGQQLLKPLNLEPGYPSIIPFR
jgi:hypothetical protein